MSDETPATQFDDTPDFDLRFPPLPRTVMEVSSLLAQQTDVPDAHRLVEIVNADPVVAAAVLRRINSAYYGMRRRIDDIQRAVFLLGFLEVSNLVLTTGMLHLRDVLETEEQVRIFEEIMRVSIGTAAYAHEIAEHLDQPQKATAFTIGLLHTIGRLVLLYNKPSDYEALWWTSEAKTGPSALAERRIFGTDHAQMAAVAGEHWKLPEDITTVLGHYLIPGQVHAPDLRALALTLAVSVAATNYLEQDAPEGRVFQPPPPLTALAKTNEASENDLMDFIKTVQPKVRSYIEEMLHS